MELDHAGGEGGGGEEEKGGGNSGQDRFHGVVLYGRLEAQR